MEQKPETRQLKVDQAKLPLDKTKAKEKKEDHSEVGGNKLGVLAIIIITVILGLLFSLKAGLPSFKFGSGTIPKGEVKSPGFNLDLFGSKVYRF